MEKCEEERSVLCWVEHSVLEAKSNCSEGNRTINRQDEGEHAKSETEGAQGIVGKASSRNEGHFMLGGPESHTGEW